MSYWINRKIHKTETHCQLYILTSIEYCSSEYISEVHRELVKTQIPRFHHKTNNNDKTGKYLEIKLYVERCFTNETPQVKF